MEFTPEIIETPQSEDTTETPEMREAEALLKVRDMMKARDPEHRTQEDIDIMVEQFKNKGFLAKPEYSDKIQQFCQDMIFKTFDQDDIIFRKGDEPDGNIYILLSGEIAVYVPSETPEAASSEGTQVATLKPGFIFGEKAVLEGHKRVGTIVPTTMVDCAIIFYPKT